MAIPLLTLMPDPPLPTDAEAVFDAKAGAYLTAEQNLVNVDLNTKLIPGVNAAVLQVMASEDAAAGSAGTASNAANSAAGSQTSAAQQAQAAQAAAVAAGAATGLGALGNPGDAIIVKDGRAGVGYAPVNRVGDILITAGSMAMPWVPANGGIRNSFSYPTLAAALGKLGGQVGQTWLTVASVASSFDVASAPGVTPAGPTRVMTIRSAGITRYSADGGNTWTNTAESPPASGSTSSNSIFYDETTDTWIALCPGGSTGFMFVSNNNGTSWSLRTIPVAFSRIATDQNGVWIATPFASNVNLYRSTDFGMTWNAIAAGANSATGGGISTDGKGVWCACKNGLLRSVDGGLTWVTIGNVPIAASFLSNNRNGVWLAGLGATSSSSTVYKSSDNGSTWTVLPIPSAATISDIAYSMGFFFIVRSVSPQLITISDQPDVTTYNVPSTAVLAGLSKVTAVDGYVIAVSTSQDPALRSAPTFAYDPVIQFQLPDFPVAKGLRAWIKAASGLYSVGQFASVGTIPAASPSSLAFDGISTVIVSASNMSTLMRSIDKGVTWTVVSPNTGTMTHIVHVGGQNWFACGAGTAGVRSSDNGVTWTPVTIATGAKASIVAGSNGRLIMTNASSARISLDYGATWALIPGALTTHRYPCTDGGGNWLIASSAMNVAPIVSRDNGATWQTGTVPATEGNTVSSSVMFQDGSVLLSTNSPNGFLYSADLVNWSRRTRPATLSGGMLNTGAGVVLGLDASSLCRSVDYGQNWYPAIAYGSPRIAGKIGSDTMLTSSNAILISPANTWV